MIFYENKVHTHLILDTWYHWCLSDFLFNRKMISTEVRIYSFITIKVHLKRNKSR